MTEQDFRGPGKRSYISKRNGFSASDSQGETNRNRPLSDSSGRGKRGVDAAGRVTGAGSRLSAEPGLAEPRPPHGTYWCRGTPTASGAVSASPDSPSLHTRGSWGVHRTAPPTCPPSRAHSPAPGRPSPGTSVSPLPPPQPWRPPACCFSESGLFGSHTSVVTHSPSLPDTSLSTCPPPSSSVFPEPHAPPPPPADGQLGRCHAVATVGSPAVNTGYRRPETLISLPLDKHPEGGSLARGRSIPDFGRTLHTVPRAAAPTAHDAPFAVHPHQHFHHLSL